MNEHRFKRFDGNIYLTGFMASGKSTVGRALASAMEKEFRDLDTVIREKAGKSIKKIFEDEGEEAFRKLEWKYLLEQTRDFKGVLALGGGALQNQNVVDHLKISGLLVYIETPMEEILERVYRRNHRPIVFDEEGQRKQKEALFEELKALYSEREAYYEQAQLTMKSNQYSSNKELVDALIEKIKQHV